MRWPGGRGAYSLARRLTVWLSLLFGLFLGVSLSVNLAAGNLLRTKIRDHTLASLRQADLLLDAMLRKARAAGYVLSTNPFLAEYAALAPHPGRDRAREYEAVHRLSQDLSRRVDADPDVFSIGIWFADGGQAVTSDLDFRSGEFARGLGWVAVASAASEGYTVVGHYLDTGITDRHFLAVVTRADLVNRRLPSRVAVVANVDERRLYERIDWLRATAGSKVYLLDDAGTVISAAADGELGRPLDAVVGARIGPDVRADARRIRLPGGGMQLLVQQRHEATGWRFLVLLPERELLAEQRTLLAVSTALVCACSLLLVLLASRIVARTIGRPLGTLVGFMDRAEREAFRARIDHDRRDELGRLFDSFNLMVGRTRRLLDDLDQEHRLAREMELKLLQSRMNPHFLYNTLDTINWLAQERGAGDISRIVLGLSDLYRTMFSRGSDVVDVREMLHSIEGYLYIQTFRYASLAAGVVEAEGDAADFLVLNLVVQPVVENAVIHGMGGGAARGAVRVRATREGRLLRIRVEDDGAGMDAAKLAIIRAGMAGGTGDGASGLHNVHRRLRLFYGPEAGLEISSAEEAGTTVDILMPVACPVRLPGADSPAAPA